jgi:hypothetical protein
VNYAANITYTLWGWRERENIAYLNATVNLIAYKLTSSHSEINSTVLPQVEIVIEFYLQACVI